MIQAALMKKNTKAHKMKIKILKFKILSKK